MRQTIPQNAHPSLPSVRSLIPALLAASLLASCKPPYQPTPEDAFAYAAGYAHQELATYRPHPSNPGCEDRPEWYMVAVEDQGAGTYQVQGRVVTPNVYCVIDQSEFTATIHFVSEGAWELIGQIRFSNECVLYSAYEVVDYDPMRCFFSQWSP